VDVVGALGASGAIDACGGQTSQPALGRPYTPPMVRCSSCGGENPVRFRHCGYCGATLGQSSRARETRKTVTILFTDVTGSTSLGARLDPESLRYIMGRYFASMREVIERHGGTVEKYIGDAVMAVFGVPVAHDEDALRAVRAAAEMREALERLNDGLLVERGVSLEARTGINTGAIVVGPGGPGEAIVVGDAVNVAARLQTAASPGEIVIGSATQALVRDAVQVGPAESIELKGKAEPVVAYRLLRVTAGAEGHRRRLDAPMVGREHELDVLQQAFERAVLGGSCQVATILGTAGVGKSRLVAEFLGLVRDRARVVRGRCLPYGEGITYWAVAEIVRQATGIEDDDSAETVRERIGMFVAGLPEEAAIARGLVGLIGLESSAAQEELVWAFRRALEHLADKRPLVVLIDDIHWAEPTLLDLVESVADLARGSPILFVCPARPEFLDDRPTWGSGKFNVTTIPLEPLTEGSALELIDALVPGGALPTAVRARITDAAEGNPLYVEEFVWMLIDNGALVADADGWTAPRDLGSIAVPPTIAALLSARLDRLAPEERAVAERASVVGRVFDQASVVALSPAEGRREVPRNLLGLVRKELIRPDRSGLAQGDAFRFRHMLIRDAAYEGLPKAERAELHELFAGWLDLTAGDRRSEVEEIVGYHLEQAFRYRAELASIDERARGLAWRAAERLIAAGRRAYERSDIAATVNLYGRAATLLDPADPARLAILPDLGRALDSNGRFDDAKACFAEALERSEAAGDERAFAHARALQCLGFMSEVTLDDRRRVADACEEVFERLADDRGLALCWRLRGEASWRAGKAAGDEAALARALEHARRAGAHREEALIANSLSAGLVLGPTPVLDGIRRCDEIIANARDDRGIEMAMSHALAHLHARLGHFDLARSLAIRCREIAVESGQRADAAHLSEVAWDVETLAGDHETAERIIAEGCNQFAAMGKPHPMLEAFLALSQVTLRRDMNIEAIGAMAAQKRQATRALLEAAMAGAHLNAGSLEEAERNARSAVDYFATTDLITFHAEIALILGDVLRATGQGEEADTVFRRALDLFRQKGSVVGVRIASARLAG
jgi:class 3 adenylate cyclase/tetratricopeptide (TPR) repeat protein